ncbi:MAG: methyltransferase domain-containing protein [Hyphomicrobiales bacterium]
MKRQVQNKEYKWEHPKCAFCGSTDQALYMESSVPRWHRNQPLRLVECNGCGLVFASPRPAIEMLHHDYLAGGPSAKTAVNRKLKRPFIGWRYRQSIKKAARFLGYWPDRLYDMGCGAGTMLLEAKSLGIEAWGNDINKAGVDRLQALGCHVAHGFSQDVDIPRDHFDIVLNFDYLEHTYTPLDDLQRCFEMTKPGGILYLETIYLDCVEHKKYGEAWKMFGPGHVYFFKPDVLQSMIESVGYEIVDVELAGLIVIAARRPVGARSQVRPAPRVHGKFRQALRSAVRDVIHLATKRT